MSWKSQTSFFKKISKTYTYLIHKNKIIIHLKKTKQYFFKKINKLPEEVVLLEIFRKNWLFWNTQRSSGRILLPEIFRKKYFFWKVSRRRCSRRFSEDVFFRMTFGYFRRNPSSGKFSKYLLLEVPKEPFTVLSEDATVTTPFPIFSGVIYPEVPLSYPKCYNYTA